MNVLYPPVFRLSYVPIAHAPFPSSYFLCLRCFIIIITITIVIILNLIFLIIIIIIAVVKFNVLKIN